MICADSYNEELVRAVSRSLPDLLLVPTGWAAEVNQSPEHGEILARIITRAAGWTGCPVVGTDCVGMTTHGPRARRVYGGQSAVADGDGELVSVLRDRDTEVRVIDLPRFPA